MALLLTYTIPHASIQASIQTNQTPKPLRTDGGTEARGAHVGGHPALLLRHLRLRDARDARAPARGALPRLVRGHLPVAHARRSLVVGGMELGRFGCCWSIRSG